MAMSAFMAVRSFSKTLPVTHCAPLQNIPWCTSNSTGPGKFAAAFTTGRQASTAATMRRTVPLSF